MKHGYHKKMVSKTLLDNNSSHISSSKESQHQLLVFILYLCLSIGLLILFLPHQYVDGNSVPGFIFAAHPSMFHALVLSVMLSFAAAFAALLIGQELWLGRFYFRISGICMASTLSILACALFLEIDRLLVSWGFKLWELNDDGADSFFVYRYLFKIFRRIRN